MMPLSTRQWLHFEEYGGGPAVEILVFGCYPIPQIVPKLCPPRLFFSNLT